jgi:hypothetical protein
LANVCGLLSLAEVDDDPFIDQLLLDVDDAKSKQANDTNDDDDDDELDVAKYDTLADLNRCSDVSVVSIPIYSHVCCF